MIENSLLGSLALAFLSDCRIRFLCLLTLMLPKFQVGDRKKFERTVREEDTANFESGIVHEVYATFALTRDAEWSSRLFVLEMKEKHEEGIGTFVNVKHLAPALIGEKVLFEAMIDEIKGNEVNCSFQAKVGERLIAEGKTGQKILTKERIGKIFREIEK